MKEKLFEYITVSIPLFFAASLASLGGMIHYLTKIREHDLPFSWFNFFLEIVTSGFVGIAAFMLCDYAGWEWHLTAFVVAISGHMGARALILFEKFIFLPIMKGYTDGYSQTTTSSKEKTRTRQRTRKEIK